MKKISLSIMCLCMAGMSAGCQSAKTRAVEGAIIGGVAGAAGGGIIGHQMHRGSEGAAIGAAIGAITGGVVGAQIEKPGSAGQSATAPSNNPNQMTIQQIVDLQKQGINEYVIIDKIHLTNSKFTLSAESLDYLRQNGVSQKIIDAMQGQ